MPRTTTNYRQYGRKTLGRPWKRAFDESETGPVRPSW